MFIYNVRSGGYWSIVNSVAKYEAAQKSLPVQAVYNSIYKLTILRLWDITLNSQLQEKSLCNCKIKSRNYNFFCFVCYSMAKALLGDVKSEFLEEKNS